MCQTLTVSHEGALFSVFFCGTSVRVTTPAGTEHTATFARNRLTGSKAFEQDVSKEARQTIEAELAKA